MCGEAAAACADGQFPPEAPLKLIERLLRLLPDGQDPLRRVVEQITGLRRGRSVSEAIEKPKARRMLGPVSKAAESGAMGHKFREFACLSIYAPQPNTYKTDSNQ